MIIKHKIDDFLRQLFPEIKGKKEEGILQVLTDYYSFAGIKPKASISDSFVTIDIDVNAIVSQRDDYRRVVSLCEKGKYSEALPILNKLIELNPSNSEYHRILGQIRSDQGQTEAAIGSLIDALKWDPTNGYALIMMGNVYARDKDDLETAKIYYDQAAESNPEDNIAINNIGANLMQQGKTKEAEEYFIKALKMDNTYPNTHYALSMVAEVNHDLPSAFYSATQALRYAKRNNPIYGPSFQQLTSIAKKTLDTYDIQPTVEKYRAELSKLGSKPIQLEEDNTIGTPAKTEIAENYGRKYHLIKYKAGYPAVDHLVMHELVHIDFIIEARNHNENLLFTTTQEHFRAFKSKLTKTPARLSKRGLSNETIDSFLSDLFSGMNNQMFNAPLDLFIEDFLYNEYVDLRPYQFLSLYNLMRTGVKAVTDKRLVEISPKSILSKSKILNVVAAMQFRELFGIDMIDDFNASVSELNTAKEFFAEFNEYRKDRKPGEEYELVMNWSEDLKLDSFFEFKDEKKYRAQTGDVDTMLKSIEDDPYDEKGTDRIKDREMEKFQKGQQALGTNMAVVMYMVDALQYFDGMKKDDIHKIAFEIAMQGRQGYAPDSKYKLNSIPSKDFSGYHILAYYYVSWALAIPDNLSQLQLPYDGEYEMAKTMFKPKK